MNIHEFQAKELFAQYGVPVPLGRAAKNKEDFAAALAAFPDGPVVVKSQIHAGGRGKGTFADGYQGGVKKASSKAEAAEIAAKMLGNTLITHQTGPAGRKVRTVYFNEIVAYEKEYYLAITLDRTRGWPVVIASTEGGVEIEKVAAGQPEKILKVLIDPVVGLRAYQARQVTFGMGLRDEQIKEMVKILFALYKLYWEKDCSLVEINPLIRTKEGKIIALDAKISFDDNALFRHPEIQALRDLNEEDPKEVQADKAGLNYIALDGDIACLVNGAGLAMATMDIIKYYGGNPANFLDVGGSANEEQVTEAFRIILSDPHVKGILVNIFGGIMKCDIIAKGIIGAAKSVHISLPLVVRLEGTNVQEGKSLLAESGLAIESADSLSQAAQKIVSMVKI